MYISKAIQDFKDARRKADLKLIFNRLSGNSEELLSYEDVRQKLRAIEGSSVTLKEIPLDAVVGSVGRYQDFTREFLPKQDTIQDRWVQVMEKTTGLGGLPPIKVYQVGSAYFVMDGNHRVSVAKQVGATSIEAYVTEVKTRVPLEPDTQPDDIILKAEYVDFLIQTKLDQLKPDSNLSVTVPGKYPVILQHIDVHRYYLGINEQRDIPYNESVSSWYDTVYIPIVDSIRERGILKHFPDRTETDLYVWLAEHRSELSKSLGWDIGPTAAAIDLSEKYGEDLENSISRVSKKILTAVIPEGLTEPPPVLRDFNLRITSPDTMFKHILVAISGSEKSWNALKQASIIAKKEDGIIHGVHILDTTNMEEAKSRADEVILQFDQFCEDNSIQGDMKTDTGNIGLKICERARWADLAIVPLNYPPADQGIARFGAKFRTIINKCPEPLLIIPIDASPLDHALLAYDGSTKAKEALYISAYLQNKWNITLNVITITDEKGTTNAQLNEAREYLEEQQVNANYIQGEGIASSEIFKALESTQSNLLITGGYGINPILEVVLGSTVDKILQSIEIPVLICR